MSLPKLPAPMMALLDLALHALAGPRVEGRVPVEASITIFRCEP